MKSFKSFLLAFIASILSIYWTASAAWIDHFEVEFSPNTAKIWEALDLTIIAADKNNAPVMYGTATK